MASCPRTVTSESHFRAALRAILAALRGDLRRCVSVIPAVPHPLGRDRGIGAWMRDVRAFRRVHRLSRARARTRVIEGVTRSDIRLTRVVNACIHQRCEAISDNACRRSPVGTAHQPPPPRRPRGLGASSSPEGLAAIQAHPRAHAGTRNREVRGYPTPSNAIQTLGPGRGPRHARSPGRTSSRAHVLARAIEKERGPHPLGREARCGAW
jgi:hypothetical protein